ncbi:hypothetical protein [Levilactobacillus yiduensis]|uniref:hypothetical protein n=1 Tax=Levilactobacillus yiduensis TaxID=2953880 RepID=UPI002157DA11|nr:hypothetical protein [Levilactobacillus yiduensis]
MNDLVQGLAALFKQAYLKGVEDGRKEVTVSTKLLDRKDLYPEFGIKPDTADKYYLYQPDFPFVQQGNNRKYYAPAVHQWLLDHQQTSN